MHGEPSLYAVALELVPWLISALLAVVAWIGIRVHEKQDEHAKALLQVAVSVAGIETKLGGSFAELDRRVTRIEAAHDRAALEADFLNPNGGLNHG